MDLFFLVLSGLIVIWAASKIVFGVYFSYRRQYILDVLQHIKEHTSGQGNKEIRIPEPRQFNS
jgi:hypothetical protein